MDASIAAHMGTIGACLHGMPASDWEAAAQHMAVAASNVCVSTARSSMFRGLPSSAAPLEVNPGGSEGMSMVRKKSVVERGASQSNSQRSSSQPQTSMALLGSTNSANAKRPPLVPLQPGKQGRLDASVKH